MRATLNLNVSLTVLHGNSWLPIVPFGAPNPVSGEATRTWGADDPQHLSRLANTAKWIARNSRHRVAESLAASAWNEPKLWGGNFPTVIQDAPLCYPQRAFSFQIQLNIHST